jgi:predicted DNA-binding transcriptional regulator AlpA
MLTEQLKEQEARLIVEPLLTTSDLEHVLQVDRRTINRLCRSGVLPPPRKLGGVNRWRPEDITAAIDALGQRVGQEKLTGEVSGN